MNLRDETRGEAGALRPAKGARRAFACRLPRDAHTAAVLRFLDAAGEACLDHVAETEDGYLATLTVAEIERIERHGIVVERGRELVPRAARSEARAVGAVDSPGLATGFVTAYLDAAEVAARIAALAAAFPALCQLSTLPYPTSGYDGATAGLAGPAAVQLLRITTAPAIHSRPGFLLICGTHAREWINPLIAIELAEQLVHNYDPASSDPEVQAVNRILDEGDVFVIPVLNPDGLNYSIHDDAGWRKNRRPNAAVPGCPGVDNNRNFEVYFGGAGSSSAPCTESYRGASAFSEPENRNVRHVLEQFPNILVGVDSHSYGREVYRPTPGGGAFISALPVAAADHAIYSGLEATLVAAIQAVNGVTYGTGTTSNHAGSSDEYMFFAHRVFGFNLECALDFQPPWAEAQAVVQEVTAGLRALAGATLDLDPTTPTPARIVQCIDRTGSMVAFGYDGPARANAKRFIDMMSLGDSIGIVSFADPHPHPAATPLLDRATIELPLMPIDDPGDYATARAGVDAIAFGGWTPIGAGLAKAADQLAGAPAPRAVVLLSDGFENREPLTADVLSTFPADVRVFTIALGAMADVPLLQSIATQTGGTFHASPTALDLHEIYNQVRADVTDDGLVLNEAPTDAGGPHVADVEHGAEKLLVSLSWSGSSSKPHLAVVAPGGRAVREGDRGVEIRRRDGYVLVEIARPVPGRWRVCPHGTNGGYVVAAFVRSPLKVDLRADPRGLVLRAAFDGTPLAGPSLAARAAAVPAVARGQLELGTSWSDTLPPGVRFELAGATRSQSCVPLELSHQRGHELRAQFAPQALPKGIHNVRVRIEGRLPGNAPFTRTVLRTIER